MINYNKIVTLYMILIVSLSLSMQLKAQSISLNTSGAIPDSSAMLDIISNNKGLLIPRISLTSNTDDTTIVNPAVSLLVYNINPSMTNGALGFWYWNGTQWVQAIGPAGATGPAGVTGNTGSIGLAGTTGINGSTGATGDSFWTRSTGLISPVTTTDSVLIGKLYGSTGSNGDITINGTTNATKTTSYVNLQTAGGKVGIGKAVPAYELDVNGFVNAKSNYEVSRDRLIVDLHFNQRNIFGNMGSETILDNSPYNNHFINDSASFVYDSSFFDKGFYYSNNTRASIYTQTPPVRIPIDSTITYCFWINVTATPTGRSHIIGTGAQGSSGYEYIYQNGGNFVIQYGDGVTFNQVAVTANFTTNSLDFYCIKVDYHNASRLIKCYKNGSLTGTNTMNVTPTNIPRYPLNRPYVIARYAVDNASNLWTGYLGAFKIYSRALTDVEIMNLYLQRVTTYQPSLPQSQYVYQKSTGELGIGTTNPTSALHTVASGAKTISFTGNLLTNTATSSTNSINKYGLEIQSTGTWNGTSAKNTGLYISSVTGGTNNYDAIFNGGGNVGIGTTSPAHKLHIENGILALSNSTTLPIGIGANTTSSANFAGIGSTINNDIHGDFLFGNNISINNNREIKTTNNHGSMTGGGMVIWGNGAPLGVNSISFYSNSSGTATAGTILTNTDARLHIRNNGNIGIGTTTAASKLDVEGGVAIGASYSGITAAPSNGAIIEGNVGLGLTSPTAILHLKAGTATASTAPLKFTITGAALNTTPERGSIEAKSNSLYYTDSTATRKTFAFQESPTFTGTPAAPTQTAGDSTTAIATTAFVDRAIANLNIYETSFSLSSSDILALNTSPKTVIPSPGSGKYIEIISASSVMETYSSPTYSTYIALQLISAGANMAQATDSYILESSVPRTTRFTIGTSGPPGQTAIIPNTALQLKVATGNPTAGNSSIKVKILYRIVTI